MVVLPPDTLSLFLVVGTIVMILLLSYLAMQTSGQHKTLFITSLVSIVEAGLWSIRGSNGMILAFSVIAAILLCAAMVVASYYASRR